MSYKIQEIEGIGPTFAEKLSSAKIMTTDDLLDACASKSGRKSCSEKTELTEQQLLKWANMADLMRISGIGPEFAELLHVSGVDTVKELRNRNAENLAASMKEVNEEKKLTRAIPAESVVSTWIDKAKETEPKITH